MEGEEHAFLLWYICVNSGFVLQLINTSVYLQFVNFWKYIQKLLNGMHLCTYIIW